MYPQKLETFIRELPGRRRLRQDELCVAELLVHSDSQVEIFYAPFDLANSAAKIVIVGVTPGWQQMEIAYRVLREQLGLGASLIEGSKKAKETASFAGAMRTNLVSMMNTLELNKVLGISSTSLLFDDRRDLLHTTSAVRYPTFLVSNRENYTGSAPSILRHEILRSFVTRLLDEELTTFEHALIIPLGKAVGDCLQFLIKRGAVERVHCLLDFPHPSGSNGHRVKQFEAARDTLASQIRAFKF